MDLDLRYETAFAASPDILALWEEGYKFSGGLHRPYQEAYLLWHERYKFAEHYEAYFYWKATR